MPRTMHCDGLGDLLEKQSSVASRGQLLKLGMSDRAMQYRLRRGGPWQMLLPGVYLAASGIPSVSQKELAAMLYADSIGKLEVLLARVEATFAARRSAATRERRCETHLHVAPNRRNVPEDES